jgi:polysaccharide biosynthesis transport protein
MLQRSRQLGSAEAEGGSHIEGSSLSETLSTITGTIRRQLPIFLVVVALSVSFGLLYLLTSPSRFTATATMVIDTHKIQLFQQQSVVGDMPIDAGTVQTEVEILKSQNVSKAVIKDLRLTDDPEFVSPQSGLLGAVASSLGKFISPSATESNESLERKALARFESARTVNRVGLTYVMEIGFQSLDPGKAAQIANAIADAYVTDQLEAKYQSTRRASLWLQDRIKELREQASTADKAVVDFKQAHNIVEADGKLMNEQNVSDINSQAVLAHAATAEAKAKLDRITDIMKQEIPDASAVADALNSQVIIKLRSDYLDLQSREALLSAKYGPNHLAVINLRNQMQQLRRNISDEMGKIAASYRSDYEIAKAREEAIKSSLSSSVSASQITNQAQVQLRELESNAQSYRAMYDNFLQNYMSAVQQQSFPISEARLISPAESPLNRSSPKTLIILAVTVLGGLLASTGIAALREMSDRVFRTSRQVEQKLQASCLAIAPAIKAKFPKTAAEGVDPKARLMSTTPSMWRYVVEQPFSQFTEALRAVKVAADLRNVVEPSKVIGFTSTVPNEGKSTLAINFAQLMAHAGSQVLLVDADLRNPSVTRGLAPGADMGLIDIIAGRATFDEVTWRDPDSGLTFLPVSGSIKLLHTSEILGSEKVRSFFQSVRDKFDYVIVDFAPLAPVVDTRTTTSFIDSYVYVVEWGRSRMDIVEKTLGDAQEIHDRLLGVVLNKADLNVLGRYEGYRTNYYYRKYYARYGYTS